MDNTNDGIYLNSEINGNNFVQFCKKLTKFVVIALLISTGFINETNGMRHETTTQCFNITNKEVCGNVLLYHTGAFYYPIALQSGSGSASAKQLAEKTKQITTASSLVLSGLDVVLAVGTRNLEISDSGNFYESTYANVELRDAVKTLEMGNWNPREQAIGMILTSLHEYGNLLNNINWGQGKSAISNQTNKNNWLQILTFLIAHPSPPVSNALKNLIPAMARGKGFSLKNPATLDGLVDELSGVGVNMQKEDIKKALLWGRYSLHTEPQVEVLSAVGNNINVVSWTLNTQTSTPIFTNLGLKIIQLMGDCYSLYNPCPSCQGLNWVIFCKGKSEDRFLFCLGDNSYGGAGLGWPVDFQSF